MVEKAKTSAATTVMRSRLRSTTVEPAAVAPILPPNMSDSPPPFPLCRSTRKMSRSPSRTWMSPTQKISLVKTSAASMSGSRLDDGRHFGEVAGDGMTLATIDQCRLRLGADVLGLSSAGAETASGWRVDRARHVALEHDPLPEPLLGGVWHGH